MFALTPLFSMPTVADLDGDGNVELVWSDVYRWNRATKCVRVRVFVRMRQLSPFSVCGCLTSNTLCCSYASPHSLQSVAAGIPPGPQPWQRLAELRRG